MKTLSIKKLLASTLALAALTLTACNNFDTDDEENTETGAYLKVSGSTARTIAPNYSLEDMTEFELYGYNSRDTYYLFGEFDSYAELQEAVIAIERGTYRLYLSAYDENTKTKFTAGQYNVEIKDGLNKVEFNLSPYGNTGIRVTFTIPDANAVKSVQAGLFDRSTDEESRYRIEPLPLSITDEGARAVYERGSIDPGTYRLKAWFYADEEQKALVTTYSELVKVTRNSMSIAERVLSKLNDIYTITENMEGGEYSGYRTPETVYTRYNSDIIKLPERNEMKKEGYFFDGWFTAPDGAGEQITEVDPAEGKNITVYAKWIRGCAISSPSGFTDNESYGDTYMVRLIGSYWGGDTYQTELAEKLRVVSGDKHITLDMTQATGIVSLWSFSDCTALTSIEIPESVRRIGAYAFKGCTALTSITIPENVTNIGASAFKDCTALTSITIPENVESIDGSAFEDCTALTSITILGKVTSINKSTFAGCKSLMSITIPESVESIAESAFAGCKSLTSITIPESVTTIDDYAFQDCTALTDITIPGKVTSIGKYALNNCTALESVTIPGSVTTINESGFKNCTSLKNMTLLDGVKEIGDSAFSDCTALESVTIPDSVTTINDSAFKNCTSLKNMTLLYGVTTIGQETFQGCAALESITMPDSVTSIGGYAFQNCTALDVVIPDSVTKIGTNAVTGCRSVALGKNLVSERSSSLSSILGDCKSVIIKNDVTDIGYYVFKGCDALENVTIPDSVKKIGMEAFQGCTALKSVVIPDSVTVPSLGAAAFTDCTNCTVTLGSNLVSYTYTVQNGGLQRYFGNCKAVIIKNGVNTIWDFAFLGFNCQSLTIPSSVKTITNNAFQGTQIKEVYAESLEAWLGINFYNEWSNPCNNGIADLYISGEIISDIEIPDISDIYEIKKYAFHGCKTLKSVRMHDEVTEIGKYAFKDCTALESVKIGDSVTTIGSGAFYGCTNCTVTLGKKLVSKEHSSSSNLTSYFKDCKGMIIKDGVTAIGYFAFSGYESESLTIPASVTSIGRYAFKDCTALKKVTYTGNAENWLEISFSNETSNPCNTGADLYIGGNLVSDIVVPDGTTSIKPYVFYGCGSLKNVTIGKAVTSIKNSAFAECKSLESVVIDDDVATIGKSAFANCTSINSISLMSDDPARFENNAIADDAFTGCKDYTLTVGACIASRESTASDRDQAYLLNFLRPFENCVNVTIKDGVERITKYAFYMSSYSIMQITIPTTVTRIEDAFYGMSFYCSYTYKGTRAEWEKVIKDSDWWQTKSVHCSDDPS